MKRTRHKRGSVVFNRRSKTWHFLWCVEGKRRSKVIGSLKQFPSKARAQRAAEAILRSLETASTSVPTVKSLVESYRKEKMPQRISTRLAYEAWLRNHVIPRWGDSPITALQARPVELWLQSLTLSPKSRVHVRGLLRYL